MERIRNLKGLAKCFRDRDQQPHSIAGDVGSFSANSEEKPDQVSLTHANDNNTIAETIYVDIYDDNSPFAEVRSSVPNYDDETMSQTTLRVWVIGLLLLTGVTVTNTLFFIHDPPFRVKSYFIIVVAWPLGWVWERIVPNVWGLNPGKFTYKEHALISVMLSTQTVSIVSDTATTFTYFYENQPFGSTAVCAVMLGWAAQLLGICIAGLLAKVLVYPPSMVWPSELVTVTLLSNMHVKWNYVVNGWRITRQRFFIIVCIVCTIFEFFSHFFFRFLGQFSVFCWISPDNYVVNQLFGTFSGAGMLPLCFDWNTVSGFFNSPLVPPGRVFLNSGIVVMIIVWLASTAVHYSNTWWGQYLPFLESMIYDRFGDRYQVSNVLKNSIVLSQAAFEEYSAVFVPTLRLIAIGMGLSAVTSVLVHALLFDRKRLLSYFSQPPRDVHTRLMQKYPKIPNWWFYALFLASVAFFYPTAMVFDTGITGWYPIVAIATTLVWILPVSVVYASTTMNISLRIFSQIVAGYMRPKHLIGIIAYRDWPADAIETGVQFAATMKFGHYTKIRPRMLLLVRLVGVFWSGLLEILILIKGRPQIPQDCAYNEQASSTCAHTHSVLTSAIMWGIVGSDNMMKLYWPLLHFLWIGALVPFIAWLWLRKYPLSKLRIIHWPIFFNTLENIPTATAYNLTCWVAVGIIFNYWVRRYWHSWWAKYCYTLSAALDLGLAVVQLVIFFALTNHGYYGPKWWGNNGYRQNIDAQFQPMKKPQDGNWFGPKKW